MVGGADHAVSTCAPIIKKIKYGPPPAGYLIGCNSHRSTQLRNICRVWLVPLWWTRCWGHFVKMVHNGVDIIGI